jgi:hypothetical protein
MPPAAGNFAEQIDPSEIGCQGEFSPAFSAKRGHHAD